MPDAIPAGYHAVTPYLITPDGDAALKLYAAALGAEETMRLTMPDGKTVGHAEMKIGDSVIMLASTMPDMSVATVGDDQWPPISLMVYVEDVDASYKQAVDAGFISECEPTDMFYGDRTAKLRDPYGHRWAIATHVEDVSQEEIMRRMQGMG